MKQVILAIPLPQCVVNREFKKHDGDDYENVS